ncbi:hypothetical protein VZT92_016087 [Zoarces viviparus]|uniref:Uncharacterized protein n=1 Tax=Zoarces viviparus TaxID=48416 RepID=A0AAW1ESK6_ZOAVI
MDYLKRSCGWFSQRSPVPVNAGPQLSPFPVTAGLQFSLFPAATDPESQSPELQFPELQFPEQLRQSGHRHPACSPERFCLSASSPGHESGLPCFAPVRPPLFCSSVAGLV